MRTAGRTYVLTGAGSGIGFAAARAIAGLGARVLLCARNRERGEPARRAIVEATGNRDVELLCADLSQMANVRTLAADILDATDRIDGLIHNAGLMMGRREMTADGFERTFAMNHLAPFLLTHQLLDALRAASSSRIVMVASDAHRWGRMQWEDLHGERRYGQWRAYAQSKLANILFSYHLSGLLNGSGVTVNCMHPGWVDTGFGREATPAMRLFSRLGTPFKLTAEQGADTVVFLATEEEVSGVSGCYFVDRRPIASSPASYREEDQCRLWEVSMDLVRKTEE